MSVKYDKSDAEGKFYRIAVVDTGPGIGEKDLPFMFKKYWQKAQVPIPDENILGVLGAGGAGLGLAVCKTLVEVSDSHPLRFKS